MKKFAFALVALLALSFTFMSCGDEPNDVLEAKDVTADWCNGTWSGTEVTTVSGDTSLLSGNTSGTREIVGQKLTVSNLTTTIALDGSNMEVLGMKMTTSVVVKANKKRTKLNMVMNESISMGDLTASINVETNVEKD